MLRKCVAELFGTFTRGLFAPPAWRVPWLPYARIAAGAELILTMSASAGSTWGTDPADRPQTLIP